jgi:hypothetical protein
MDQSKKLVVVLCAAATVAGCGDKTSATAPATSTDTSTATSTVTSAYSAEKPSAIMGVVAGAVSKVGGGMASSTTLMSMGNLDLRPLFAASDCTVHGEPAAVTNRSLPSYPGLLTYCKMTTDTNDEESVQGVFTGVEDIACMLEHAGPTYDGVAHSLTLTFDGNCFTPAKLANMEVTSGTTVVASVTASSPAAFNTYYDRGVDIRVDVGGNHHYTFGTKVTASAVEVTFFDEDADRAHKTGAGAGSLDLANGILRVESRMDRIGCDQSSSCGWNRHVRLYSTMTMDGVKPKDPKEIQFLYSNVSSNTLGAQSSWDGYLVTASGDLSDTGVKPRGWTTGSGANDAYVNTLANWTENTSSTDCFTQTSQTAGTCGTGLNKMTTNAKFVMAVGSGYTIPATWFAANQGLKFTTVSADDDTP